MRGRREIKQGDREKEGIEGGRKGEGWREKVRGREGQGEMGERQNANYF